MAPALLCFLIPVVVFFLGPAIIVGNHYRKQGVRKREYLKIAALWVMVSFIFVLIPGIINDQEFMKPILESGIRPLWTLLRVVIALVPYPIAIAWVNRP